MAMVANNWTQRADLIPRQQRGQEDHPQDSQFSMTKLEIPTVLQRTVVALWILTVVAMVVLFLVKELNLEGLW